MTAKWKNKEKKIPSIANDALDFLLAVMFAWMDALRWSLLCPDLAGKESTVLVLPSAAQTKKFWYSLLGQITPIGQGERKKNLFFFRRSFFSAERINCLCFQLFPFFLFLWELLLQKLAPIDIWEDVWIYGDLPSWIINKAGPRKAFSLHKVCSSRGSAHHLSLLDIRSIDTCCALLWPCGSVRVRVNKGKLWKSHFDWSLLGARITLKLGCVSKLWIVPTQFVLYLNSAR